MSKTLNKVMLIGNLGKDPEIRYTADGFAIANISVATVEVKKNRDTGENQETTTWHRVVAMGKLAEIMGEFLKKGSKVHIEGRLQNRSYEDKNTKETKYITEIFAENMIMLSYANAKNDNNKNSFSNLDVKTKTELDDFDISQDIPF